MSIYISVDHEMFYLTLPKLRPWILLIELLMKQNGIGDVDKLVLKADSELYICSGTCKVSQLMLNVEKKFRACTSWLLCSLINKATSIFLTKAWQLRNITLHLLEAPKRAQICLRPLYITKVYNGENKWLPASRKGVHSFFGNITLHRAPMAKQNVVIKSYNS